MPGDRALAHRAAALRDALVEHSIGLLQLAGIIANPSQEIPAIQLVAGVEAITDNGGSAQPVLDREAIHAIGCGGIGPAVGQP